MIRPRRVRAIAAAAAVASLAAVPAVMSVGAADAEVAPAVDDTSATDPTFTRHDIDAAAPGAAFTSVGEVFAGEKDIVTSVWGLFEAARPLGPGALNIYRPGANLDDWTTINVFGPEEDIWMPNATTVTDVDGDGDNDLIVPAGHFFGTDTSIPAEQRILSGSITWWENKGTDQFTRHNVITDQGPAYHGVQYVDLDGDGFKDILTVAEEARAAGNQGDDSLETQVFLGSADLTFTGPIALADVGGSQPVVADVDEDGDLDIITARYFDPLRGSGGGQFPAPSYLWMENTDQDGTLTSADFAVHTIATVQETSFGFQIQPVVGFREPGKVSWIATNHANRCTFSLLLPPFAAREQVIEFVPGDDIRAPWEAITLSDPETPVPPCPADYLSNRDNYPTWTDAITSRPSPGQGAPGTFGYGDIDGDGDIDLGVSGDGDRRLWWIEQQADGGTTLHRLTAEGEHFGQSGGGWVVDFNKDGVNELVFSSWDQGTVAIWTRTGTVTLPRTVDSKLSVTPAKSTVKAGKKGTWTVKLTGAEDGPKRTVKVVFDPAKGKNVSVGKVVVGPAGSATLSGKLTWKPKTNGKLVFTYAGTTVSDVLSDTAATATAKVTVKK
ncbi:VCBS repeat-containing protein [Nocardioides sp. SR21]|uniref:FG-GAP repeat domain-containing protein n=1 Tax=Nocardioides sp. SR21 TaxID=2919501 RepID=UPI001FA945D2|nr:VCBS repeat-containing protein [Nocardioides sp. SR21]